LFNFDDFDKFGLGADVVYALTFQLIEESGSAPDELNGAYF
jgi:hypothetical protein